MHINQCPFFSKSLFNSLSNLKSYYKSQQNYWSHEFLLCKFENRLESENRREIQKNILEIAKNILSRGACVRQRSLFSFHSLSVSVFHPSVDLVTLIGCFRMISA